MFIYPFFAWKWNTLHYDKKKLYRFHENRTLKGKSELFLLILSADSSRNLNETSGKVYEFGRLKKSF